MSQSLVTFGLALVLGLALSRLSLRSLSWLQSRERKAGKERIHKLFPKPRRPLGGGLAIMVAATVSALLIPLFWGEMPAPAAAWAVLAGWGYALIGLTDDLRKVSGRGLREKPKLALQVAIALAFGWLLWELKLFRTVWVPFYPTPLDLGPWHIAFAAIVMLATANAVNLSDGVDGLAGGAAVVTLLGLVGVGLVQPGHAVAGAAWPFVGAILGFLAYNLPPGRLLMGDTGALAIGAVIATLATFAGVELWLLPLAAPFVVNAASVLLQLGMVRGLWRMIRPLRHRTTETPRPFLCTPLHHHFQWLGWGDWKVLGLFWGLGAVEGAWTLVALGSGLLWLLALGLEGCFLLAAASQKALRAQYFLGLLPRAGQPSLLALYRGMPAQILGLPLYRVHHETSVTEDMLVGATAESILWRPISEVEAHVVLGKIYADQKLFDEAVREWEQVPVRNLLLRPTVVLRLARIYYGRDRLLEAIKLWEELPLSRLEEMPNVREVVRSAKLRLADLASKSHRQSMRMVRAAESTDVEAARLESYLIAARRWNQELLSLLLYERDKLRGKAVDPQAVRARRELLRVTRAAVMARIREVDERLGELARATASAPQPSAPVGHASSVPPATGAGSPPATTAQAASPAGDAEQRAAQELHVSRQALLDLVALAGKGTPHIMRAAVHPKASRNSVFRLHLEWPQQGSAAPLPSWSGPSSVIVKRYAVERITFFSACYRRERGVLELLHRYGCAVPRIFGGELQEEQALLVMQDLGDETLAERLEASDARGKQHWLRSAVTALVSLHATAYGHLSALAAEIQKVDKERLGADYYLSAIRIAMERISGLAKTSFGEAEWQEVADQSHPLVDFLCERPACFIHFELTPHHFLVADAGLHVFDFEQATVGPLEFDLAALLAQPESDAGQEALDGLVQYYRVCGSESGLPVDSQIDRGVAYAALFKCLVYAGAAANFLDKFGGEHHLQRLHYYLNRCQAIVSRWPGLRPLRMVLGPRLRAARWAAGRRHTYPDDQDHRF